MKEVTGISYQKKGYGHRRSSKTIKEILKEAGYTEKEIKKMKDSSSILIFPGALSQKLRHNQRLFIEENEETEKRIAKEAIAKAAAKLHAKQEKERLENLPIPVKGRFDDI